MKKLIVLILTFVLICSCFEDADAQRTRKRKSRETTENTETTSFAEKMNYEIKLGNPGFSNGFSIALKSDAFYKFNSILSAGGGGKMFYDYLNLFNQPDISLFTYGGFAATRIKIVETFYLQGEYHITKYPDLQVFNINGYGEKTIGYPAVGLGYLSGFGNWKYGLEGLFILNEEAADRQSIFEYWISFSYNF